MSIGRCINLLDRSLSIIPQELNELDWKSDITPNHEKLKQHLSAFSNYKNGGYLVFGIEDSGNVIGISKEKVDNITNTISNLARDSLEPPIQVEFHPVDYRNTPILVAYIPESQQTPVYIKGKTIESAHIRSGGRTRVMSRDEIKRSIITSRSQRFEELPANLPSDSYDNWYDLFDFSKIIEKTRPWGFQDNEVMFEHLYNYKLLTRVSGEYFPTNLGVLCCAKDLRKFPGYEKFAVRITQYPNTDKMTSVRDIFFYTGYTLSLDKIVTSIIDILPHNEILQQATLQVVPVIPQIAIREMVANAIIHRDFTRNDSYITIEIFSNRIEITNPGGLLPDIEVDRLIDHPSRTRNEVLANIMRNLNFCEERGTGYDKTALSLEVYGLPPYQVKAVDDYFQVLLFTPKDFSEMEKEERIEAVFQHACLNVVLNKKTTNESLRKRFKFTDKDGTKVYRLLTNAIDAKRIKLANPDASRKGSSYLPYWAML